MSVLWQPKVLCKCYFSKATRMGQISHHFRAQSSEKCNNAIVSRWRWDTRPRKSRNDTPVLWLVDLWFNHQTRKGLLKLTVLEKIMLPSKTPSSCEDLRIACTAFARSYLRDDVCGSLCVWDFWIVTQESLFTPSAKLRLQVEIKTVCFTAGKQSA